MLKKKIFTPGPTQVHPEVLKASVSSFSYHRSDEFKEFHRGLISKLKRIFLTEFNLNVLTASGTGAMDASVVNFCRPGDAVLCLNQGRFGKRWSSICKTYGLNTDEITVPYGEAVNAELLAEYELQKYDVIFLTHSETSTATLTNIRTLIELINKNSDALVIADAITSVSTIEFRMDEWKIDAAIGASQKGFMTQPGLSIIAYNNRAYDKMFENSMPRFYNDLRKEKASQDEFLTTWTPAVGLMFGLSKACDIILDEGLENKWKKVHSMAEYFRNKTGENGFGIFSKHPSDSLTALTLENNIPSGKLIKVMKEKYDIQTANGQAELKDKILRVSHMGDIDINDIKELAEIMNKEYDLLKSRD